MSSIGFFCFFLCRRHRLLIYGPSFSFFKRFFLLFLFPYQAVVVHTHTSPQKKRKSRCDTRARIRDSSSVVAQPLIHSPPNPGRLDAAPHPHNKSLGHLRLFRHSPRLFSSLPSFVFVNHPRRRHPPPSPLVLKPLVCGYLPSPPPPPPHPPLSRRQIPGSFFHSSFFHSFFLYSYS